MDYKSDPEVSERGCVIAFTSFLGCPTSWSHLKSVHFVVKLLTDFHGGVFVIGNLTHVTSSSDSSPSRRSRHRDRSRRHRKDDSKVDLKIRKKSHRSSSLKHKRKHHRHRRSSPESKSASEDDYSSSDDEKKTSVKRHKRSEKDRKSKGKSKTKVKSRSDKHSTKKKLNEKEHDERNGSPVQLSKFLGRNKEDGVRRSSVSGKKILLKVDKTKEDKQADNNRNELLKFLNASCG